MYERQLVLWGLERNLVCQEVQALVGALSIISGDLNIVFKEWRHSGCCKWHEQMQRGMDVCGEFTQGVDS